MDAAIILIVVICILVIVIRLIAANVFDNLKVSSGNSSKVFCAIAIIGSGRKSATRTESVFLKNTYRRNAAPIVCATKYEFVVRQGRTAVFKISHLIKIERILSLSLDGRPATTHDRAKITD